MYVDKLRYPRFYHSQNVVTDSPYVAFGTQKEVFGIFYNRHFTAVYAVRVLYNHTICRLTIYFGKEHDVDYAAVNYVAQDVSARNARQLVFIPHEYESRAERHGFGKRVENVNIRHTYFVDDDYVARKGRSFVIARRFPYTVHSEQSVYRLRFNARRFHHTLARSARRGA